nr:hypothetical protein [Tanacetum cinerariifolium]
MIATPGELDLPIPVLESFHKQTDKEPTENDIKRMYADDQAIQTILLGLPEDVYAAIDSCETAKEIWKRVRQIMKGLDIGEQEKKAKLFNEWEKFTSTNRESIKSYYHYLPVIVPESFHEQTDEELIENDIKRIDTNDQAIQTLLLGLPEDVYASVDSYETAKEIWERNGGIQVAQNAVQNAGVQNGGNQNGLVVVPRIANQSGIGNIIAARAEGTGNENQAKCYNYRGLGHIARNCTARPRRRDITYLQTQLLTAQKEEAGIQLQVEEFDFMVDVGDLDEIEEVNANCILMENVTPPNWVAAEYGSGACYFIDQ